MDFSWSTEQRELYDRVYEFAVQQLNATAEENGRTERFKFRTWRLCGEFGLLGLPAPLDYGGMGCDALTTARVLEALGRGCKDAGLVFSISAHQFACVMPIVEHGPERLRREFLPYLCSGQWVGANAITEAESGSDAFAMKTRAVRSDNYYILNGTKSFVTNGVVADVIVVYAVTDPSAGFMGISAFAVHKDTAGLVCGKRFETLGLATSQMSSLYLNDCRVPTENLLGKEGAGSAIFQSSMAWERACLFAAWVGLMDRQLEEAIQHARTRRQFGKPIGKNQAISHRIANMRLRLDAARLLLYRACWLKDQGRDATLEIALSKLAVSEAVVQSSLDIIQIYGALGIVSDTGVEQYLRDSVSSTIYSGTSEIQRQIVARILGL